MVSHGATKSWRYNCCVDNTYPSGQQQTWVESNKEENQNGQLLQHLHIDCQMFLGSCFFPTMAATSPCWLSTQWIHLVVETHQETVFLVSLLNRPCFVSGQVASFYSYRWNQLVQQLQKNVQHTRLVSLHWSMPWVSGSKDFLTETVEYDPVALG